MSTTYSQEHIDTIRLIRSQHIGPGTFHRLLDRHGTVNNALRAVPSMATRGGAKSPVLASEADILDEITATTRYGAQIITLLDAEYPSMLRMLDFPPPVLTVYGNTDLLNTQALAVVGARNASANGYRFAYHMAKTLGSHLTIVSGLARGIDTAAHHGALESGTTIAVTACGIDQIYPQENEALYRLIGERGIIVTEMPFGTPPKSQNFPKRNRIISGLSLGTLVIEAGLKSGSLITAQCALEQNKEIFAVPGSPLDHRCHGTNHLLKEGAHLVTSPDDILAILNGAILQENYQSQRASSTAPPTTIPDASVMLFETADILNIHNTILEKLSPSPTDINDIISQTDLTASHILTILLELELAGKVKRYPGNKIALHAALTSLR